MSEVTLSRSQKVVNALSRRINLPVVLRDVSMAMIALWLVSSTMFLYGRYVHGPKHGLFSWLLEILVIYTVAGDFSAIYNYMKEAIKSKESGVYGPKYREAMMTISSEEIVLLLVPIWAVTFVPEIIALFMEVDTNLNEIRDDSHFFINAYSVYASGLIFRFACLVCLSVLNWIALADFSKTETK